MSGMVAETKGPGANKPENNGRRIEQGSYQLATQDGGHYVTFGFVDDDDPDSVKNVDSAQTEKLLGQLLDDIGNEKNPPEIR